MTEQPTPDTPTAPECLNDACTMDCTTECRAVIQRAWDALRRTGKTAATDAARQAAVAAGAHVHTASAADGIRCDSGECTRPDNSRTTADNPGLRDRLHAVLAPFTDPDDGCMPALATDGPGFTWVFTGDVVDQLIAAIDQPSEQPAAPKEPTT